MSLKKRIEKMEKVVRGIIGEEIVAFTTRTEEEFERKKEEYLKDHPEPHLFIRIIEFTDPPDSAMEDVLIHD